MMKGIEEYRLTNKKGAQVSLAISALIGEKFLCEGCGKQQKIDYLHGFKHPFKGLMDNNGKFWLMYYKCSNSCRHHTSFENLRSAIY